MDRQTFLQAVLLGIALANSDQRPRVLTLTSFRDAAGKLVGDFWSALQKRSMMVDVLREFGIALGEKETAMEAILLWAEKSERRRAEKRVVQHMASRVDLDGFDLEKELEAALAKLRPVKT